MGNKVIKSVSFNQTVADDKAMLKHFSRKNFSGYVKKLILIDMKARGMEDVELSIIEKPSIPSPREQIDLMKKQRSESKQQPAPPKINLPKP